MSVAIILVVLMFIFLLLQNEDIKKLKVSVKLDSSRLDSQKSHLLRINNLYESLEQRISTIKDHTFLLQKCDSELIRKQLILKKEFERLVDHANETSGILDEWMQETDSFLDMVDEELVENHKSKEWFASDIVKLDEAIEETQNQVVQFILKNNQKQTTKTKKA